MAIMHPTMTPEQLRAFVAALEMMSANAAMLAKGLRDQSVSFQQIAENLAALGTMTDACRALAGLPPQGMPS